ncbi:MAG: flagellar protein FlaG [Lachnospiraceae bacterium]|nr:flagellar protein FlaG [Lachnospiraceae bacterium]
MAVEPLGSIMSVQAQGAVQSKPVAAQAQTTVTVDTQPVEPVEKIEPAQQVQSQGPETNTNNAQDQQASPEQIRKAVEQLNKNMRHSEAVFGIHEKTNRVTIKIVDKETKEVIREVPPEKTLDMIAKVWEIAGILVDEKR